VSRRNAERTAAVIQALEKLKTPRRLVSVDDPNLVSIEWLHNEWEQARSLLATGNAMLAIDKVQQMATGYSSLSFFAMRTAERTCL